MIEANHIAIHVEDGELHGKFIREYRHGIIIKTKEDITMIPWHNICYVEYHTVDKRVSNAINEIVAGKNAA